jgi:hypothetical protein
MVKLKDILNEFMATDLFRGADAPRKGRAKTVGIRLSSVEYNNEMPEFIFNVIHPPEHGGSGRTHQVHIRLDSFPDVIEYDKLSTMDQIKHALVAGDIHTNCTCEDFLYKGFAYIGTQLDYSLQDEDRPPVIRNPNQEGTLCKHTLSVIKKMNLFYRKMSSMLDNELNA